MMRKAWWAVMLLGLAMIVGPFALGMPSKAGAGQRMMNDFRPLMQQENVDKSAAYYNDVFVPLGDVMVPAMSQESIDKFSAYVEGFAALGADAEQLVPALAQALTMTPEQVQGFMAQQFPAMTQILTNLPAMQQDFEGLITLMKNNVAIFEQVPAGLDHYGPLLTTMQGNVADYKSADSLPNMNLFAWFFVVPGILLVAMSAMALVSGRRDGRVSARLADMPAEPVAERDLVGSGL